MLHCGVAPGRRRSQLAGLSARRIAGFVHILFSLLKETIDELLLNEAQ
jgi:hypothetical protein